MNFEEREYYTRNLVSMKDKKKQQGKRKKILQKCYLVKKKLRCENWMRNRAIVVAPKKRKMLRNISNSSEL